MTCVYLACKIEEFYVTINDFVHNVRGDKKKAAEIILNNELQLTQELQFHLIIHQPFRPVEGLLIDIKVCGICYKIHKFAVSGNMKTS